MSDSSDDSSVGVAFGAADTIHYDQNGARPEISGSGHTSSSSGSESQSSSEEEEEEDEEDSDFDLIDSIPMSKKLGYVDVFEMKTKLDHIRVWLSGLKAVSKDNPGSINESALRHHKRAVDSMRSCLRDAAPMAVKISQYMDASVKKTITTKVDKVIAKMLRSEGAGSIAMKKLLAQTDFKTQLLENIEQEVLDANEFPYGEPRLLTSGIGGVVDSHLGCALLEQAKKQTEADLLEKFNADRKKAVQGVEDELRSAGLMS